MNVPSRTGPDYNPFMEYGHKASQRNIVGTLLKFSKGDWRFGDGRNDVFPDGTRFVANMDELLVGWIRWGDGSPQEHLMGRVIDGHVPERRSELGDMDQSNWETDEATGKPRDPWQPGNYMLLKGIKDNAIYTFATGSRGGTNCVGELCKSYAKQMRQRPDEYPIIAIATDSYEHKNPQFGWIKTPELKIVGWAPRSEFDQALLAAQEEANAQSEMDMGDGSQRRIAGQPQSDRNRTQF